MLTSFINGQKFRGGLGLALLASILILTTPTPAVVAFTSATKPVSDWQVKWNETLAKARQEGRVVFVSTNAESIDPLRKAFRTFPERFGFEVHLRLVREGEFQQVLLRECAAGRVTTDVYQSAMGTILRGYPQGCLAPVRPNLILPEVTDPSKWRDKRLKFVDPENAYIFQFGIRVDGVLGYNRNLVPDGAIRSYRDLLRPELKGKIASIDPLVFGIARSVAGYLLKFMGEQFVRDLYIGQEVVFTRNHDQLAAWVARGTYHVALEFVERAWEPLREEGFPLSVATPEDLPGQLSGATMFLHLMKNAPHPNAAVVLLNWLASQEGQTIMVQALKNATLRTDLDFSAWVPKYRIPRPGVNYFDITDLHWYTKEREELLKILDALLRR